MTTSDDSMAAMMEADSMAELGRADGLGADHAAVLVCESCTAVCMPEDAGPAVYECGGCGAFNRDQSADGDSSRCPSCNKFAGKLHDRSCPECEIGELEEGERWTITIGSEVLYAETLDELEAEMAAERERQDPKRIAERKASTDRVESAATAAGDARRGLGAAHRDVIVAVLTAAGIDPAMAESHAFNIAEGAVGISVDIGPLTTLIRMAALQLGVATEDEIVELTTQVEAAQVEHGRMLMW